MESTGVPEGAPVATGDAEPAGVDGAEDAVGVVECDTAPLIVIPGAAYHSLEPQQGWFAGELLGALKYGSALMLPRQHWNGPNTL